MDSGSELTLHSFAEKPRVKKWRVCSIDYMHMGSMSQLFAACGSKGEIQQGSEV